MLVLSRHVDERIIIGHGYDAIIIHVVALTGDKVKLGIEAPPEVRIDREELREKIEREGVRQVGRDVRPPSGGRPTGRERPYWRR